jgi:hypothetical protein
MHGWWLFWVNPTHRGELGVSANDVKSGLDLAAVAGGVGSWLALLPDVAALLSIIWLAFRIWETETVKRWTRRD